MKIYIPIIILALFVGYFWVFNENPQPDLPWRTDGNYFTVEWIVPENVVYYRGFLTSDSIKMVHYPFSCQEVRMAPPLKAGRKQSQIIRYKLESFTYDLYVEIFAFDIDGNYWNLELLNFEEETAL